MTPFFHALLDPDVAFLRYAFLVAVLASVSLGIVGTYVVARRITYIAGAIAHASLAGIGAALYARHGLGHAWADPMLGAVVAALAAALVIGTASLRAREREDTIIGAVWAVGMAAGLVFIAKTPGYVDAMSYLFGDILYVSRSDLWLVLALDAVVAGLALFFYNKLLAVCFDEEFARLRGIHVERYYLLLLCLTAVTVVLFVRIVGIVLVIALVTLPPAVAGQFTRRLGPMMALAVLVCMVVTGAGLAASYTLDFPSGPTIILLGGAAYFVSLAARRMISS